MPAQNTALLEGLAVYDVPLDSGGGLSGWELLGAAVLQVVAQSEVVLSSQDIITGRRKDDIRLRTAQRGPVEGSARVRVTPKHGIACGRGQEGSK